MLQELPADMDGTTTTPAADHLFQVNKSNLPFLDEKMAHFFHHHVAKSLFLCKHARRDLQTAMTLLPTRVKKPDIDDYLKLSCMMQYLHSTRDLTLTLKASCLNV